MDISSAIAVLGVLSLSVERVVEMVKNIIPPLSKRYDDERKERCRRFWLHFLAAISGFFIALAARQQIEFVLFQTKGQLDVIGCAILGLLASGGSGFWNQTLGIVEEFKKSKRSFTNIEAQKLNNKRNGPV